MSETHPTWMYRLDENGKLLARIFDSDAIPKGWVDSPAKARKPLKLKK